MNSIYEFLGHFDIPLHKSVYPQDKYGAADNHLALAFICVLLQFGWASQNPGWLSVTSAFSFKFHAFARDDGRADSISCLSATIIRLDTFLIAKILLWWIFFLIFLQLPFPTLSAVLWKFWKVCVQEAFCLLQLTNFCGGKFLFSLHCLSAWNLLSSSLLSALGRLSCPPHTPELPFCCSHSQVMLGWALWALLNAQLPLILVQGAIAREKANQGKWQHFAGNSSTATFRLPI